MSKPFFIWTMRRTGGTTLTDLLMKLSEYPKIQHEPFNQDRIFGWVSTAWYEHRDVERTRRDLNEVLKDNPLIKHCFEIHGPKFNKLLLEVLRERGCRQMLLLRDDEVSRIMSLQLAQATGVWGKMGSEKGYARFCDDGAPELFFDLEDAREQLDSSIANWAWLKQQMEGLGIEPYRLRFEDLYDDVQAGMETVRKVLQHLDFPPEIYTENIEQIENILRFKGQNSAAKFSLVQNADAVRNALQARYDHLRNAGGV